MYVLYFRKKKKNIIIITIIMYENKYKYYKNANIKRRTIQNIVTELNCDLRVDYIVLCAFVETELKSKVK